MKKETNKLINVATSNIAKEFETKFNKEIPKRIIDLSKILVNPTPKLKELLSNIPPYFDTKITLQKNSDFRKEMKEYCRRGHNMYSTSKKEIEYMEYDTVKCDVIIKI
jgi:hypothetical protein